MLLQWRQRSGKQLGLVDLGLGAFSPGRMGVGTEWCQIILQREHAGFECHLTNLGLWAFGEKPVFPQNLPSESHRPRNYSHLSTRSYAPWTKPNSKGQRGNLLLGAVAHVPGPGGSNADLPLSQGRKGVLLRRPL